MARPIDCVVVARGGAGGVGYRALAAELGSCLVNMGVVEMRL